MKKTSAKPRMEAMIKSLQNFKNLPWMNKTNWKIALEVIVVLTGLFIAVCVASAWKEPERNIWIVAVGKWFIEAPDTMMILLRKLFLLPAKLWRGFGTCMIKLGNCFSKFGTVSVKGLKWILKILRMPFDLLWSGIYFLVKGLEYICLQIRVMPGRIQLKVKEAGIIPKLWVCIRAPWDLLWHIINFFVWVIVSLFHLLHLSIAPATKIMEWICLPFKFLVAIVWTCVDKITALVLFLIDSISIDAVEDWWNNMCIPEDNCCSSFMKPVMAKLEAIAKENMELRQEVAAVRELLKQKQQ